MSTTGRSDADTPSAGDVASRLQGAEFVRLIAARTGDGAAATGLLADALDACGVPYQTSVVGLPAPATNGTDADVTVTLGRPVEAGGIELGTDGASAARRAFEIAGQLTDPDPVLAVAGTLVAGDTPGSELLGAAREAGIEPRPGIAAPGVDPVDGLAHSTLVHGPFSGDVGAASATLAGLDLPDQPDDDARQRVASAVALAVARDEAATERGTVAVERFLRPLAGGPMATVGGFGDVLGATAREQPGRAVLLALGVEEPGSALSVWREHASRAHSATRGASTERYDGLYVARETTADGRVPVGTVARLLCAYRSPEPVVLAVADGVAEARAAVARPASPSDGTDAGAPPDVGAAVERAAGEVGGTGAGGPIRGRATFDVPATEFVAAFREAL